MDRVYIPRRAMKGKREGRSVILHPEAKAALQVWLKELQEQGYSGPDSFVFQSRKGANRPISRVRAWQILNEVAGANGLQGHIGTHSMRKTFADRIYDRLGHDIYSTQKALGHSSVTTTAKYLSFRQEEIDQAILEL